MDIDDITELSLDEIIKIRNINKPSRSVKSGVSYKSTSQKPKPNNLRPLSQRFQYRTSIPHMYKNLYISGRSPLVYRKYRRYQNQNNYRLAKNRVKNAASFLNRRMRGVQNLMESGGKFQRKQPFRFPENITVQVTNELAHRKRGFGRGGRMRRNYNRFQMNQNNFRAMPNNGGFPGNSFVERKPSITISPEGSIITTISNNNVKNMRGFRGSTNKFMSSTQTLLIPSLIPTNPPRLNMAIQKEIAKVQGRKLNGSIAGSVTGSLCGDGEGIEDFNMMIPLQTQQTLHERFSNW